MDYGPWKDELVIFSHFGDLRKKSPKNAQNSLKSSKIAVFRFLVNEYSIEINRVTSNLKLTSRWNGKLQKNKHSKLQMAAPQNYN